MESGQVVSNDAFKSYNIYRRLQWLGGNSYHKVLSHANNVFKLEVYQFHVLPSIFNILLSHFPRFAKLDKLFHFCFWFCFPFVTLHMC